MRIHDQECRRGRETEKKKETKKDQDMEREKVGKVKNNIHDKIGTIPMTKAIVDGLVLLQNSKKLVATDEEVLFFFDVLFSFFENLTF